LREAFHGRGDRPGGPAARRGSSRWRRLIPPTLFGARSPSPPSDGTRVPPCFIDRSTSGRGPTGRGRRRGALRSCGRTRSRHTRGCGDTVIPADIGTPQDLSRVRDSADGRSLSVSTSFRRERRGRPGPPLLRPMPQRTVTILRLQTTSQSPAYERFRCHFIGSNDGDPRPAAFLLRAGRW